jgi:hypothetical protein
VNDPGVNETIGAGPKENEPGVNETIGEGPNVNDPGVKETNGAGPNMNEPGNTVGKGPNDMLGTVNEIGPKLGGMKDITGGTIVMLGRAKLIGVTSKHGNTI